METGGRRMMIAGKGQWIVEGLGTPTVNAWL